MTAPRVVLMCGVAGSGKSTHAKELERLGWLRLSIDVEAWRRGHRAMPLPIELTDDIRAQQRQALLSAVRDGRDVVVDYSFWSRDQRDDYRRLARDAGASVEVHYCPVAAEVAHRRITERNAGPQSRHLRRGGRDPDGVPRRLRSTRPRRDRRVRRTADARSGS
jgi:predicted kinase